MDKDQVAGILSEIATLLELQGESAFRCNAYHNGARAIQQLETDLEEVVHQGKLGEIKGIGETLREKITTLVTTGSLPYYEDLKKKTPEGLLQMLRIPGLGPKKVKVLHDTLKIDTLEKLQKACESGEVAELKGFGKKTASKILEGIKFLSQMGGRVRIDQAQAVAMSVIDGLKNAPGIIRMELCGSLRRRRETIKDIDVLISSNDPGPIMDRFVTLPGVVQVTGKGDTKSSVVMQRGSGDGKFLINVDLRVVEDKVFPLALHHFTGSKEHNIAMRGRAQDKGWKISEYAFAGPDRTMKFDDEADIFAAMGMQYIPPEMREDTGELDVALAGKVPELVTVKDIQGVFHCHTVYSDGVNTVEEMALAAKALGLTYFGLGDHSQSLTIANGMTVDRVRAQHREIDALNKKLKGIKLFKGVECDILPDGSLDYDDDVLETFDYVVASVHTHFNLTRDEMTNRIVRALKHPAVTMLGHATGRLLLRRDSYQVDLEEVLQAAKDNNKMIEINAHPQRLELDWVHCKRAKALGIKLVINPDAHSTHDIALYRFGVDVARRGWLEAKDVFNTLSASEVAKEFTRRKK